MHAVTKHTPQVRRALSIGFSVLIACFFAYWILAMIAYLFAPSN